MTVRIVRTRSIPNVDTDRLITDAGRIHDAIHTAEGIHAWDDTRRGMVNWGMKSCVIHRELRRRGVNWSCCDAIARVVE